MTIKHIFFAALCTGSLWAAALPDYPVIYDPSVGGPVANPAYGKPNATSARKQDIGARVTHEPAMPRYRDASNYELNVALSYDFDATPGDAYACDMFGVDVECAYYLTQHQALTFSLGVAGGGDTENYWVIDPNGSYPWTDSYDRYSITLMGGYRYVLKLGRYCEVQLGARCGMDLQILDTDFGPGWSDYYGDMIDDQGDTHAAVGLGYAGYVNLCFRVTKNAYLLVGYQYKGSTTKPHAKYDLPGEHLDIRTNSMRWHEVRAGVSINY